jgi:hypothetical protein
MERNLWDFLRRDDGTYAVFHNGKLLSDGIAEEKREDEFCVRFGFCGQEYEDIVRELRQSGRRRLVL